MKAKEILQSIGVIIFSTLASTALVVYVIIPIVDEPEVNEPFCDTPKVLRSQIITHIDSTHWKNSRLQDSIKEVPAYQIHIRKFGERMEDYDSE